MANGFCSKGLYIFTFCYRWWIYTTGMRNSMLIRAIFALCVWCGSADLAAATRLSATFEVHLVTGVGFTPQTVMLENTYTSAVPVCTYNLPATTSPPVVPRISNITATSFDLSIQSMPNTNPGVTGSVHCIIAEEGLHTLPDGRQVQAITQTVSNVLGQNAGNFEETVDISAAVSTGFSNPIALGAVISSNDARATTFHANDCEGVGNEPFLSGVGDGICVGYHIGQQVDLEPPNQSYAAETVGVIVVDEGSGTTGTVAYEIGRGPNTIDGVRQNGASYTVSGDFEIGVATQAAENGGQGGWAVLLGTDPLQNNRIDLAIDEEIAVGDMLRGHTNEVVDYWVFRTLPAPDLEASKSVDVFDPLGLGLFAVPGNDVLYEITLINNGAGVVDNNSLFFIDRLPAELIFFNGDADGPGPETGAVIFGGVGSGLSFNPATDLRFATGVVPPSSFADCTHSAAAGFDPLIRFVCFSPQGEMLAGPPSPFITLTFRARLQ